MDTIKNYLAENKIETGALDGITDPIEINRSLNEQHRNVYRSGGFVSPTVGVTVADKDVDMPHNQYMENLNSEVYSTVGPKAFDNVSGDYSKSRLEYISAQTPLATTVRRDSLNRPMIGYGLNLDLAENFALAAGVLNKTPAQMNDIYTGKTAITGPEGRALYEAQVEQADQLISERTGDAPLRAQQRIVLTALAIHNPKLIGPGLIKSIKNGNVEGAINEIENRSNAAGSRELRMRRKRDAAHFASYSEVGDRKGNASLATMMGMTKNKYASPVESLRPVRRPTLERGNAPTIRPRIRPTSVERAEVAAELDAAFAENNAEGPSVDTATPMQFSAAELSESPLVDTTSPMQFAAAANVDTSKAPAPTNAGNRSGVDTAPAAVVASDLGKAPLISEVPVLSEADQYIRDGGMEAELEAFYDENINDPDVLSARDRPKGRPAPRPDVSSTATELPFAMPITDNVDATGRSLERGASGGILAKSWSGFTSAISKFIGESGGDPEITVQFYDLESYEEARTAGDIEAGVDVMIGDSEETAVVFPYLSDETQAADGADTPTLFSQAMERSRIRAEEAAANHPVRLPGETPQAYMLRTGARFGANHGEAAVTKTEVLAKADEILSSEDTGGFVESLMSVAEDVSSSLSGAFSKFVGDTVDTYEKYVSDADFREFTTFGKNFIKPGGTITENELGEPEVNAMRELVTAAMADGKTFVDYVDFGSSEAESIDSPGVLGGIYNPTVRIQRVIGGFKFFKNDAGETIVNNTYNYNGNPQNNKSRVAFYNAYKDGDLEGMAAIAYKLRLKPVSLASVIGYVRQEELKLAGKPHETQMTINLGVLE